MSCHFKRFTPKRKAVPGAARPAWPKEAAKSTPAQKQPPSPGQRLPHEAVFRERPRRLSSCQGAAPPSSALPRVAHASGRPTGSLPPPKKSRPSQETPFLVMILLPFLPLLQTVRPAGSRALGKISRQNGQFPKQARIRPCKAAPLPEGIRHLKRTDSASR